MRQREVHDNLRFHLYGIAIQEGGLVSPAPDGVLSSVHQERVAADYTQTLYLPVDADDGLQQDSPFDAALAGQRGVNRLHLLQDQASLNVPSNRDLFWRGRPRRGGFGW